MILQIDATGAGGVVNDGYHFFDVETIPRVGESISTEHLGRLDEALGLDEQKDWTVHTVTWFFGAVADDMGCDVLIWVTKDGLRDAIELWEKKNGGPSAQ